MKAIIQNTIDHIDMCIESSPLSMESRIQHFEEIVAACKYIRERLRTGFVFIDATIKLSEQSLSGWDLLDAFGGQIYARGLKEELELIIRTIDNMREELYTDRKWSIF